MQQVQSSIAAPAEIQQIASKYKMGAIGNEFGHNTQLAQARRRGGYVLLVFALLLCLFGLASMAGGAAGWVFILIAIFPGGFSLYCFSWASGLENKAIKVYLNEKGFIYKDGNNAAQPFRWDQITQVWRNVIRVYRQGASKNSAPIRIMHAYTIQRADGYKVTLNDDISLMEIVGDVISKQTTKVLLPLAQESYAKGDTVSFGPLSLNQQGLIKDQNVLPWQQIEAVDTQDGTVRVKRQGKWSNWGDANKIPNLFVFLNLTESILQQRNGG